MSFAGILKKARLENKLSYNALKNKVGVSAQTLFRYEQGTAYPSPKVLEKLCKTFKLNFKSTFLLIQSEKASVETKDFFNPDKPSDPELRSILLDYYKENTGLQDKSFFSVSRKYAEEELNKFPIHPIEIIILKEIILQIFTPEEAQFYTNKPFDYFSKFSQQGKKTKITSANLKWSLDPKRHLIAIQLAGKEPMLRLYDYHEILPSMPLLRKLLINAYSEKYGDDYSKVTDIIRELGTSPFHFFERKVTQEIYNELRKEGVIKSATDPLTLNDSELVKAIKEVKFDWAYNQKRGNLLITFEKIKGHLVTKKFEHSWHLLSA